MALPHLRVDKDPPRRAKHCGDTLDAVTGGIDHGFVDIAHRLLAIGGMEGCRAILGGMPDAQRLGALMITTVGVLGRGTARLFQRFIAVKAKTACEACEGGGCKAGLAGDVTHRSEGHFDRVRDNIIGGLTQLRGQRIGPGLDHLSDIHATCLSGSYSGHIQFGRHRCAPCGQPAI